MNNNCDFPQMPQSTVGNVEVDKITQLEYPLHSNKSVEGGKVEPTIYGDTITKNGKELKAPTILVSSDKPIYEKAVMFNGINGLREKLKNGLMVTIIFYNITQRVHLHLQLMK